MKRCEVVAYNTFLDLFSGCASGGVRTRVPTSLSSRFGDDENAESSRKAAWRKAAKSSKVELNEATMVHFRNLDWGMPVLRDLLIRVEYTREGRVVARAVTYVGYVGVLTGVR